MTKVELRQKCVSETTPLTDVGESKTLASFIVIEFNHELEKWYNA